MSDIDRKRDAGSSGDPLDQFLSEAQWPEPDPDALNRLREHWRSLQPVNQRRQRRRRLVVWLSATAAAVALAAGSWWLWPPAPVADHPEQIAVDDGANEVPDVRVTDSQDAVEPDEPVIASATTSRPPTPYELLVIRSVERRSSIPPPEPRPTVESIIDRFLGEADADPAEFVASLAFDHAACEQKLLRMIDDATLPERAQIIELLEHVGSRRSVPRLIALSRSPQTRGEAVRALMVLADAETIAGLVRRETDEQTRRQLLSELPSQKNDAALAAFLDLLADAHFREAALAVLDEQTMPPVERLFDFMQRADYSRRWAAAVVLGRLNDPDVTERLIRLAQSNVNRQEALAGLLASRDEQAGRFLTAAAQDQTMVGAVHSARLQLRLLSQQQFPSQQRWRNLP